MSDTATRTLGDEVAATPMATASGGKKPVKRLMVLAAFVVMLVVPYYVEPFWSQVAFGVFAAAIGAIGLNLLVGTTGQLSLAHAFFLAVGAATYCYVSGEPGGTATAVDGLGAPPVVGMLCGVALAGLAGLLFSPIAARLRGIYLGVASLGLVFIGQHLLNTLEKVTGGFNGRSTPTFAVPGFTFGSSDPDLFVLGVPFGEAEREYYLGLFLLAAAWWFAHNLLRSRPGRALQTLRDSETAAAVMGVHVQGYKARVFFVSSLYAGLAGVLTALSIGAIAPESFTLEVSVLYLAMIVLGGLGSVGGAVAGAAFVAALPVVFQRYADVLPLLSQPGQGGLSAPQGARILFGITIIAVVLFQPAGLAGLARRRPRRPSRSTSVEPSTAPAQGSTT
ncbi:MAG: Branched-chain amino acid transport system permease protein LivM [uncultured Frankineae bacterium]|uniref:Branched-chain amino acid transport system permease protein LivM n=1 Tax=uncultured Frankineae bacterium TaxID=437475 RepID=A0A6J4M9U2_9ACTN|nr:MAG: Branched-chain amino acid transport system permease protein LivM [uncultured Frankineae bacterium]